MTQLLLVSRNSESNIQLVTRLKKELCIDVFEYLTVAEAIYLLDTVNFRIVVVELSTVGSGIFNILEVIETDEKSEATLIALDSNQQLTETDKEKMIVLEEPDPVPELISELKLIGIDSKF